MSLINDSSKPIAHAQAIEQVKININFRKKNLIRLKGWINGIKLKEVF